MNKIYYIITALIYLCSCSESAITTDDPIRTEDGVIIKFDVSTMTQVKSGRDFTGSIMSLYVLVFDENGLYQSKHEGEFMTQNSGIANYRFKDIPLTSQTKPRTLHFIANYNWSKFSDAANIGRSEEEIIPLLHVNHGTVVYWQRINLPDGFQTDKGNTLILNQHVSLLRNVARISVTNETNSSGGLTENYLTEMSFCVSNYTDKGTVSPFNKSNGLFDESINEIRNPTLIIAEEQDLIRAGIPDQGVESANFQIFERRNSIAQPETFVIVKALFQTASSGILNNRKWSYYKLAIAEQDAFSLYDIKRNYHYHIAINGVATEGYSSFSEAMQSEPSNNINATISSNLITRVTDGENVLEIETALLSAINPNQNIRIGYRHYNLLTGITDNSQVTVSLEQDENKKAIASFSYNSGFIDIVTAPKLPENEIANAYLYVKSGILSRRITISLREPMTFTGIKPFPASDDGKGIAVPNAIGEKMSVSFTFPADIAPSLFPVPVYIYASFLSPDPSMESGQDPLFIEVMEDKTVRYVYMAEYKVDERNKPIPHTLYFMTSIPSVDNRQIKVDTDLFNPFYIKINTK